MSKLRPFSRKEQQFDIVVVGGGLSGVCAAIAAAQEGAKVALVHDRPVLGGPSSSEIGVLPTGSEYGRYRYSRETGLIESMRMQERMHYPQSSLVIGQVDTSWDITLWDATNAAGVELFLNCVVYDAECDGSEIIALDALQSGSEHSYRFFASQFIDCTGDGTVAALSGAAFRIGREAHGTYGESLAQDEADDHTLCSSLLFRVKEYDRPMPFEPPKWAYNYPSEADLPFRDHKYIQSGYWWIEAGGTEDTIGDNEAIRNELLKMLYGVWDHIKNHGDHGAENMALDWISLLPGKRESRRIQGAYTLCEKDLYNATPFEDTVAYGGWFIDFHLSEGLHSKLPPADNYYLNRVYPIPLSCLYAPDMNNLMMAGRDASFSHVALMSTRVMSTCAVMGEAVGVLAACCVRENSTPAMTAKGKIQEIQQILLKRDCYLPGIKNSDPLDLARSAKCSASSESALSITAPTSWLKLETEVCQVIAYSPGTLTDLRVQLRNHAPFSVEAHISIYEAYDFWDRKGKKIAEAYAQVPPSDTGFIPFVFNNIPTPGTLLRFEVERNEHLSLGVNYSEIIGTQAMIYNDHYPKRELEGRGIYNYFLDWKNMPFSVCFTSNPVSHPFGAEMIVSGVARPERQSNIWISDPACTLPQWIELKWDVPIEFTKVALTFDTNLSKCIWQLETPYKYCVSDYQIEAKVDGNWALLKVIRGNYQRHNVICCEKTVTDAIRITITANHGGNTARIYECRVYKE